MTIYNHKNEMRQKKQLLTHLLTQNAETGVWQSGIASAKTRKKAPASVLQVLEFP